MKILHVAHALPSKKVTNQDLIEEMLRRNRARFSENELKELQQRMQLSFRFSGTEIRYHRAEGEKAFTIGMRAGQLCAQAQWRVAGRCRSPHLCGRRAWLA